VEDNMKTDLIVNFKFNGEDDELILKIKNSTKEEIDKIFKEYNEWYESTSYPCNLIEYLRYHNIETEPAMDLTLYE